QRADDSGGVRPIHHGNRYDAHHLWHNVHLCLRCRRDDWINDVHQWSTNRIGDEGHMTATITYQAEEKVIAEALCQYQIALINGNGVTIHISKGPDRKHCLLGLAAS